MSLIIRIAETRDIPLIQQIEAISYDDPWPNNLFYLLQSRSPDLFLVATYDGEIIGYAIGEIEDDVKGSIGHIVNIAVSALWRRMRIGDRLLNDLERCFIERGVTQVYLEVRVTNVGAQALYKKRGYEIIKLLKSYYLNEDGFYMEKSFKR